jgi:hypothetical protein
MEEKIYSKPHVEVLQVGSRLMADDFNIGVSGTVNQGGEDSKGMYFDDVEFDDVEFDDDIWDEDSVEWFWF